jgi:membrane associated rhomboid family serine protease
MGGGGTPVTMALIAINVVAFLAELAGGAGGLSSVGGTVYQHGALYGPAISGAHEYWRLVTGGFLHAGLLHIGFNMYLLYLLGQLLEPQLGSLRFAVLYLASLLAGSFGALLLSPDAVTVGASGAVFGLMGAAFVESRIRGADPFGGGFGGIGGLIVINLVLSVVLSHISLGGHIGGLIGGGLCALALHAGTRYRQPLLGVAACVAIAAVAAVGGIAAAGASTLSG